jgi:threonine dehydratase
MISAKWHFAPHMEYMFPFDWLTTAASRIAPHIKRTPVTFDSARQLYLKWENQQVTGSFKARGAFNKVLSLEDWEQQAGIVTASAGNHGQGVALAGKTIGAPVKVFASEHASPLKLEKMRKLGAEVELVPGGYELAEATAIEYAAKNGKTWVSAYNDSHVIAGQGTVGLEIAQDVAMDETFSVIVPTSGGGLAAGIGAALHGLGSKARVVAVQPEASAFMYALYNGGAQQGVKESATVADGLTGAVEDGSLTIPLVRRYIHQFMLVSEDEISRAIALAWREYGQVIEGSAAVALAAALGGKLPTPAVVVVSGGNILPELHAEILARWGTK